MGLRKTVKLWKTATVSIMIILSGQAWSETSIPVSKISSTTRIFFTPNGMGLNVVAIMEEDQDIVLIDSLNEGSNANEQLHKQIKELSSKPVRYIINTDSDSVHKYGYTYFENQGATIVTHADAPISDHLSSLKYSDNLSLKLGNEEIFVKHFVVNSFDDSVIHLKHSNLIIMGNLYTLSWLPVYFSGGANNYIEALDEVLSWGDSKTRILPAKGPLKTKEDLLSFRNKLVEMMNKISWLYYQHKSVDEMLADKQLNKIWQSFNTVGPEAEVPQRVKEKLLKRYLATDFVKSISLNNEQLSSLQGEYQMDNGRSAVISTTDNRIYLKFNNSYKYELLAISEEQLHFRGVLNQSLDIKRDNTKQIQQLILNAGEQSFTLKKVNG